LPENEMIVPARKIAAGNTIINFNKKIPQKITFNILYIKQGE